MLRNGLKRFIAMMSMPRRVSSTLSCVKIVSGRPGWEDSAMRTFRTRQKGGSASSPALRESVGDDVVRVISRMPLRLFGGDGLKLKAIVYSLVGVVNDESWPWKGNERTYLDD